MISQLSKDSVRRTIIKTLSWRVIGSGTTFFITWYVTGDTDTASAVFISHTVINIVLYYFHERIWNNI